MHTGMLWFDDSQITLNMKIQKAMEYRNWAQGKYLEERASALPQVVFGGNALRTFDDSQSKLFKDFMPSGDSGSDTDIGEIFGGRQDIRSAGVAR